MRTASMVVGCPRKAEMTNRRAFRQPVLKREKSAMRLKNAILVFACFAVLCFSPLEAQQKGQWVPGQYGLNAGVVPDPGFTYENLTFNFSASQLNDSNGHRVPNVTGTYAFWAVENVFMYVSKFKILGAKFFPYAELSYANGSLVADLAVAPGTNLKLASGGSGYADTYFEPAALAWNFKRADVNVAYAFVAPTGRYSAGASDNVGSGYWGNIINAGTTVYLTKNKGTSANLFTVWETHGKKSGSNETPGQAFTTEWGLGQVLPLKKDFSALLQLGLVGYDQWQITDNGGTITVGGVIVPASTLPYYSVHGIGVQSNFILPKKSLSFFFKYYNEYTAKARSEGRTFVFGGSWTLKVSKPAPPRT